GSFAFRLVRPVSAPELFVRRVRSVTPASQKNETTGLGWEECGMKRALVLIAIGLLVLAFVHFGLVDALTLENLKAQQGRFEARYLASPVPVVLLFFAFYVAVTAASLPGAAILTMAAGALFGLFEGTIIVSFASSIGATLAFLSSRYVFRDWVRARFG